MILMTLYCQFYPNEPVAINMISGITMMTRLTLNTVVLGYSPLQCSEAIHLPRLFAQPSAFKGKWPALKIEKTNYEIARK